MAFPSASSVQSPWEGLLQRYDLILGSQSPRRVELLRGLDLSFEQIALPDLDESFPSDLPLEEVAQYIAERKAEAYRPNITDRTLLITADTVVLAEGQALGKPLDALEAERMLRQLSGRTHRVMTGVCITTSHRRHSFATSTLVHFDELSDTDIAYYLSRYAPYDKAGAYGIQEWIGYRGIRGIEGSFYNVMGLPVHQLARALALF